MLGGAAATLMGLIFMAVSLGANPISPETRTPADTYVTPVMVFYKSVLLMACVMLIPTSSFLAILLLLGGTLGLHRMARVVRGMLGPVKSDTFGPGRWLWHGFLPLARFGLIIGSAIWLI